MIRVANAPCSWGALEFEGTSEGPAALRVLEEMRAAGFVGTELGDPGFLPEEPGALSELLDRYGLELVGGFVPVALSRPKAHPEGVERAVRTARQMAQVSSKALVVLSDDNAAVASRAARAGRIRPEDGLDDEGWTALSAGADRIARAVFEETGLVTAFHHHAAGYVETPAEVAELMTRTDPERVRLCLDTGHWAFGGGDPLDALERYGSRIVHVHFKDFDPEVARLELDYLEAVGRGVFCELGRGAVDFVAIVDALKRRHYDGWIVVEQDILPEMGTPFESAKRNRAFLRSLSL